jgi:hypothetical protein
LNQKDANSQSEAGSNESAGGNKKQNVKWVPTPNCEKVFSLAKDETFLFDETKVIASNGKLSYAFVITNKKYEYFFIEDGKRSGPFNQAPVNQLHIRSDKIETEEYGSADDEKIEISNDQKDPVAMQYSKTINNQ